MQNGGERLQTIAFVVSIFVIIGIAISFSILFSIYAFYKKQHIIFGHEDKDVESSVKEKYDKSLLIEVKKQEKISKEKTINASSLEEIPTDEVNNVETVIPTVELTYEDGLAKYKEKGKKNRIILDCVFGIFYVVLIGLIVTSIVFKANKQAFYIGDTTYITIQTGSMEKKNSANTYLKEYNLNNQIERYSLIGLKKVDSCESLKLYDIAAYKYEGNIYVHRIIKCHECVDGSVCYTFRGDSNNASLTFELNVKLEDIIGRYTGYQDFGMGVFLTYLQSTIGMVALGSATLFLLTYSLSDTEIEISYEKREVEVAKALDVSSAAVKKKEENEDK